MRLILCLLGWLAGLWPALGQPVPTAPAPVESATSGWQRVSMPGAPSRSRPTGPVAYHPAFTGDFVMNRTGWFAGTRGGYHYQIGFGKYNVRQVGPAPGSRAFSAVPLPADINLNLADYFTIKVDVVADSGRIPNGGLVFGVLDSLNYCSFTLNPDGTMALARVVDGRQTDPILTGLTLNPGVPVVPNRNQLILRRVDRALHVFINQREVRGSPFAFEQLPGNGIGITAGGDWTSFQKLLVTLGPDQWSRR